MQKYVANLNKKQNGYYWLWQNVCTSECRFEVENGVSKWDVKSCRIHIFSIYLYYLRKISGDGENEEFNLNDHIEIVYTAVNIFS